MNRKQNIVKIDQMMHNCKCCHILFALQITADKKTKIQKDFKILNAPQTSINCKTAAEVISGII